MRCGRCWRRCGGSSSPCRSTPCGFAARSPMRSSPGRAILSEEPSHRIRDLQSRPDRPEPRRRSGASRVRPAAKPYAEEIGAWQAEKDQYMRLSPDSPVPEAQRATFPPLSYFPINEEYRRPGGAEADREHPGARDVDLHRPAPQDAPRRLAGVHAQGPAADADGVRRSLRERHAPAVRAVRRPDQRLRDLPGRPLSRSRPHGERRLRPRFQPRLSPVLPVQLRLRLPGPAAREPAAAAGPRRRTAGSRPH